MRYIAAVNTPGKLFTDLGRRFDSEMLLLGYAEGHNAERVNSWWRRCSFVVPAVAQSRLY